MECKGLSCRGPVAQVLPQGPVYCLLQSVSGCLDKKDTLCQHYCVSVVAYIIIITPISTYRISYKMSRIPVSQRFGLHKCHGGCDTKDSIHYARKSFQCFHVSVHEIPFSSSSQIMRQVRLLTISLAFYLWYLFYPAPLQLRSLLAATTYTFIECTFTYFSDGKAFTSFAQFWGNLLYTPILLDMYWDFIFGQEEVTTPLALLYIVLFPINVWILEIVLDQWYLLIYGRNVAWCYCTYSDSYVGGVVRLGHGIFWLLMGVGCCRF